MASGAVVPAEEGAGKTVTVAARDPLPSDPLGVNSGADTPDGGGPGEPLGRFAGLAFGIYLIGFLIIAVYFLQAIWPEKPVPEKQTLDSVILFQRWHLELPPERRYILIVVVAGALGSFIHLATSFTDFVGNRRLMRSWMWWYMLRPCIGVALALLIYFAIRGGLMTAGSGAEGLSAYGVAAIAGLAGMFSKQATDKLREVCDNALNAGSSAPARSDGLEKPKAMAAGAGK